ncbi:hypothetical protein ARMGADRAFT_1034984 [Armillaria gallica]|uniref:Uncharacterized protein n=1 Tax=Armillaria gallica TaxID=47427 RepID=A0A2H3DI20_ARMGA|nr:hypothetical protein ARMGADRAFT_1034984 [Armillaria gallica]
MLLNTIVQWDVLNLPIYTGWTMLIWEYLITIDDEIDLFWVWTLSSVQVNSNIVLELSLMIQSSKLSWIKCLFFVNRYLVIALRVWDTTSAYFPLRAYIIINSTMVFLCLNPQPRFLYTTKNVH